jgi:hypothetical protein
MHWAAFLRLNGLIRLQIISPAVLLVAEIRIA